MINAKPTITTSLLLVASLVSVAYRAVCTTNLPVTPQLAFAAARRMLKVSAVISANRAISISIQGTTLDVLRAFASGALQSVNRLPDTDKVWHF